MFLSKQSHYPWSDLIIVKQSNHYGWDSQETAAPEAKLISWLADISRRQTSRPAHAGASAGLWRPNEHQAASLMIIQTAGSQAGLELRHRVKLGSRDTSRLRVEYLQPPAGTSPGGGGVGAGREGKTTRHSSRRAADAPSYCLFEPWPSGKGNRGEDTSPFYTLCRKCGSTHYHLKSAIVFKKFKTQLIS